MHQASFKFGRLAASLLVAGAAALGAGAVQAQGKYPDRAIRLIVPFPPGGQTDNVSRRLAAKITPILGEKLIIDNRSGAAGTLGSGEAARAKPDGYTLLVATTSTHTINPIAMAGISYDAVKDFAPITVIGTGPIAVSVHPSVPARNVKQLVAAIKGHARDYSYGSSGIGSINHLAAELFLLRAGGLHILHVPYKGSGASVQELVGGQIPALFSTLSAALPHHRSGRARTLAVMKEERSPGAPEIPTTAEAGVPGAIAYTYNILLAPVGTPRSQIDYLSGVMRKVMDDRSLVEQLVRIGVDPITDSNPEKAAAMLRTEHEKWKPLIDKLGLRS